MPALRGYARRGKSIIRARRVDRSGSIVFRWSGVALGVLRVSSRWARYLALPLALLLFLQWPLRELAHVYSREANDLAQILFALYVSVAVSDATRRRAHIAADAFAHRFSERTRIRLARAAALLVLVPWCTFVLYASAPLVWNSVRHAEAFGETLNPGYFLIKVAVALLVVLVLLQALLEIACPALAEPKQ
jgi:TRAP-type mannitol/chloroaromatic compound transport system permease small subunit